MGNAVGAYTGPTDILVDYWLVINQESLYHAGLFGGATQGRTWSRWAPFWQLFTGKGTGEGHGMPQTPETKHTSV